MFVYKQKKILMLRRILELERKIADLEKQIQSQQQDVNKLKEIVISAGIAPVVFQKQF